MECANLSPKVLVGAKSLLEHITTFFWRCLKLMYYPEEWKMHKIVPIPKRGDPCLITNYTPISLSSVISKVLESIIFKKIIDIVHPHHSQVQFGFLSKRSRLPTCWPVTPRLSILWKWVYHWHSLSRPEEGFWFSLPQWTTVQTGE